MGRNPQVCVACAHNCRLFHQPATTSPTSFFKVIVRRNDFTILYIPPMLNRTLSALVNKKINLEDSSGRRWLVKVSNVDGSLAFEEGWNGFSLSHKLQIGDFLVFNYINKLHFDVKIFDETGCERLNFPKKRIRENRHMSVDLGGTQNSIENTLERVNKKGKAQSMCITKHTEDTCCMTTHMYQNDAALCYRDPMLEEVMLGTGDTSYASELGMLSIRNNSFNETDEIAYDEICTLKLEESLEQNPITMSKMEVEEFQFDEGLGSDDGEIHKEFNAISDISDSHVHIGSDEVEIHKEFNAISDILVSHVHIDEMKNVPIDNEKLHAAGSDEVEIHKEKHPSDIGGFHNTKHEFNVISDILDSHAHIEQMKNVAIDMTPISCSFNEKSHASGSDEVVIYKEKHALDIGGFHNIKQEFNVISDNLDSHIHIDEMKKVPIDMTPKLCSFNENLHVAGLPEAIKGEFDHSCHTFDEDNESHFETEATVSCVALTDNNCLKLPECLPLSRSRRKEQMMVVFLKDPLSRLWPVFYHKKPWLNILTDGWVDFQRANDIKPEDVCVFKVENQSERIVAVHIVHN